VPGLLRQLSRGDAADHQPAASPIRGRHAVDEDEECPKTGLTKTGCSHCRGLDDPPTRKRWTSNGGWFESWYGGICQNCGGSFEHKTLIKKVDDGYVAWCCRNEEER
jgi:hypothetical protein